MGYGNGNDGRGLRIRFSTVLMVLFALFCAALNSWTPVLAVGTVYIVSKAVRIAFR